MKLHTAGSSEPQKPAVSPAGAPSGRPSRHGISMHRHLVQVLVEVFRRVHHRADLLVADVPQDGLG